MWLDHPYLSAIVPEKLLLFVPVCLHACVNLYFCAFIITVYHYVGLLLRTSIVSFLHFSSLHSLHPTSSICFCSAIAPTFFLFILAVKFLSDMSYFCCNVPMFTCLHVPSSLRLSIFLLCLCLPVLSTLLIVIEASLHTLVSPSLWFSILLSIHAIAELCLAWFIVFCYIFDSVQKILQL